LQGFKPSTNDNIDSDIIKTLQKDLKEKDDQLKELRRKYNNAKSLIKEKLAEIENLKKNGINGNNGNNTEDKTLIKELEEKLAKNRIHYENLLNLKDKEIIELKNLIQTYEKIKINNEIIDNKKIDEKPNGKKNDFALLFVSTFFSYAISCSEDDIFAFAEEKLYQKYEEYRDTDNIFIVNGKRIKRFRTIKENKLESGMPIIVQQIEGLDNEKIFKQYQTIICNKNEDKNKIQDNNKIEDKNKIENKPNGAPSQIGNKDPKKTEKKTTSKRDIKNTKKK